MDNKEPSPFNRRKFITNAAKVAGVGAVGFIYFRGCKNEASEVVPAPVGKHVFLTKPYLHAFSNQQVAIRWISNLPSYSWVEYGVNGKLDQKAFSIQDGLVDVYSQIHEVQLEQLIPAQLYQYRVASKMIRSFEQEDVIDYGETIYSDTYTFTSFDPNQQELRWLVLNDLHDRPESFPLLLNLVKKEDYDFVFLNGDMFNFQTDEEQVIDHLIKPCTDGFASTKPLIYVRGNHEMRGRFAQRLKDYFSFPQGQYFAYQIGPVYTIVLDTGEEQTKTGFDQSDAYREKQAAWMVELMKSAAYQSAKYKVVMMHIPPQYSFEYKGSQHCKQLFSPILDRYGVDLVISGHTHVFGVHPPVKGVHNYPIIIGGGPLPGNRTIIHVKAGVEQLNVKMIKEDGIMVGEYQVKAK